MKEHDPVVLTRPLSEHALEAGDVGAIVHVYEEALAYEVEFVGGDGNTLAVVTLRPDEIRPIAGSEILHVRSVPA
jgi:hypothetical protein